MIRLDTMTKIKPTRVGMSYADWCASYCDSLGAPITVERMIRHAVSSLGRHHSEQISASQGMTGWGGYDPYGTGHTKALRVAISSRKGQFTFGSV